jgi:hypothetical protein
MSWKPLAIAAAAGLLLAAGCGGGLSPDTELEGEIGSDAPEIGDAWEDAEEQLLAWGRPVDDDWPCTTWKLTADGPVKVEVETDDFDPVLCVYDGSGEVAAFCDDWDGDLEEAMVVLESVPEDATLILFGAAGDDGEFELSCTAADDDDVEEFEEACDLSDGSVEGYKPDDKDDDLLDEVLSDAMADHVDRDCSNAAVFGFDVEETAPVRVTLSSDDFDPYLVLLGVDGDELFYIDYNDDAEGYNSAVVSELEEGRYLAVALSYSDGGSGDFVLGVEVMGEELMQPDPVDASEAGVSYEVEVTDQSPIAYAYVGDVDAYVAGLEAFTPVAAFEFTVEEAGFYRLDGFAGATDVVLSLWEPLGETQMLIDYNDDGGGLTGTNSRLVLRLQAGEYLALVNSLGGQAPDDELGFSWQSADEEVRPIMLDRPADVVFGPEMTDAYFAFELEEPGMLRVTADGLSDDIDPYIDLWAPDGSSYSDDDGGGDFNSLLEQFVSEEQTGEWTLHVTTYSGGSGRIRTEVEFTEEPATPGSATLPEAPPAEDGVPDTADEGPAAPPASAGL